jgi:hypothetical protein
MDIKMTQKHNKVKQIVSSNNKKKALFYHLGLVMGLSSLSIFYNYIMTTRFTENVNDIVSDIMGYATLRSYIN